MANRLRCYLIVKQNIFEKKIAQKDKKGNTQPKTKR